MLKQKFCSLILAVVLLISLTPTVFAANTTSYDLSNGPLTLTSKNGDITVTGSYNGYGAAIRVQSGYEGTITLDNVSIDAKRDDAEITRIDNYNKSINGDYDNYISTSPFYSAISIAYGAKPTINIVGENKIISDFMGINNSNFGEESSFLITGTGTLNIDTPYTSITDSSEHFILDIKGDFKGIVSARKLTINKEISINSQSNAIEANEIIINAKTTANGSNTGIYAINNLIINAETTANGIKEDGIYAGELSINAPTYAKGKNGIFMSSLTGGNLTIVADTTAIGTNGYGVRCNTKIVYDGGKLNATGTVKDIQQGQ